MIKQRSVWWFESQGKSFNVSYTFSMWKTHSLPYYHCKVSATFIVQLRCPVAIKWGESEGQYINTSWRYEYVITNRSEVSKYSDLVIYTKYIRLCSMHLCIVIFELELGGFMSLSEHWKTCNKQACSWPFMLCRGWDKLKTELFNQMTRTMAWVNT